MPSFAELLRAYRLRARLSQELLAERAQISLAAVGALERGTRRAPYRSTVALLADALALNADEREALEVARRVVRRTPVRSDAAEHLPSQRTSFVGRDDDIAGIIAILGGSRLVTITGSGGVGKTRIALESARRLANGSWDEMYFVDLAPLSEGALLPAKVAATFRPPIRSPVETMSALAAAIAKRKMLLILDNCEHIIADVANAVRMLLESCPRLAILATSRETLSIGGESVYRLPSLAVPESAPTSFEDAQTYSAIDLFVQRAEAADTRTSFSAANLDLIVRIARRLDGIPLAIELAAAQLPAVGLHALQARLDQQLDLAPMRRDLPARQQTVNATIGWSFGLLSSEERLVLCTLAIFSGGFTLSAAEVVCASGAIDRSSIAAILSSLVNKSLVGAEHTGDTVRYRLLESVRTFAQQQLDGSLLVNATARRHAEWLANIGDGIPRPMPFEVFTELFPELDNARAAIAWALNSPCEDDLALGGRIVAGLRDLWYISGHSSELRRLNAATLTRIDEGQHPILAANLLHNYIVRIHNEPEALAAIERAIPLFDRIGDARLLMALHSSLTFIFAYRGLNADARASAERVEELFAKEQLQTSRDYATFLYGRAMLYESEARFDDARADVGAAEAICKAHGDELYIIRKLKVRMIYIESSAGNLRRAIEIAHEMLESEHGAMPEVLDKANGCLACLHLLLGETDAAEGAARAVLSATRSDESLVVQYVAGIAALRGHSLVAARLMGFIDALLERVPSQRDLLQQRTWDLVCAAVAKRVHPDIVALWRAEGAKLSAQAAAAEALAALTLR
jgi:predicted ATPase/transcriptional regulator with XRE-family HTH domain